MKWVTHQENMSILGMQGSGKTTLAKNILYTITRTPRIIISPQQPLKLYSEFGDPISKIEDIQNGRAMLWVGKTDEHTFSKICKKVMTLKNMVMVVDDAHEFSKKQKIPAEWSTLINSGRNRGITSIFISPSPNLLHNVILQSSQHLFSFRFVLESQIEYAKKNFFGDTANLLLFKPARPEKFQKYPEMGKHDYLHRYVEDDFVTWYNTEKNERTHLYSITDSIPGKEKPTEEEEEEMETNTTTEKKKEGEGERGKKEND